jgi:hypothetical protein
VEAEDSGAAGRTDRMRTVGADQNAGVPVGQAAQDREAAEAAAAETEARWPDPTPNPDVSTDIEAGQALDPDTDTDAADDDGTAPEAGTDLDAEQGTRKGRPVSSGIGCAALLLPLVAVAGAILCFAAGILSTVTGCTPNGSALCSANGAWFEFVLPLFVSPIIAAAAAIGAVTVRRHRSSWLAVGYGIVFISIIVGLASASTGSS